MLFFLIGYQEPHKNDHHYNSRSNFTGFQFALMVGITDKKYYVVLCFGPPVRAVCPNHEVVVFQPRAGNALYLGSVTNYTFLF